MICAIFLAAKQSCALSTKNGRSFNHIVSIFCSLGVISPLLLLTKALIYSIINYGV